MSEPRFVADSPDQRCSVALDTLTAIYHRRSGQTHIASEPVPEMLEALSGAPQTARALLSALRASVEALDNPEALEARLAELLETGLVARV